jgi:GMP synthase (glutamine-hydrolysing)
MTAAHDAPVLVVDFGAQYAQLIARRVREARVYSEIVPHTMPVDQMLAKGPQAIILSGGPSSIYAEGAPDVEPELLDTGVPTFGICYGFHAMAQALGGTVTRTGLAEFGRTPLTVTAPDALLFRGLPADQLVWMSHGDEVSAAPDGFAVSATTAGAAVAAFEDPTRGLAGVQFHPEAR